MPQQPSARELNPNDPAVQPGNPLDPQYQTGPPINSTTPAIHLTQKQPGQPQDWSQNPTGYQQYLNDSNAASNLRQQGQYETRRVYQQPSSTGGHGLTETQTQQAYFKRYGTQGGSPFIRTTSQGIQLRDVPATYGKTNVYEYNKLYGFPARDYQKAGILYYEITPKSQAAYQGGQIFQPTIPQGIYKYSGGAPIVQNKTMAPSSNGILGILFTNKVEIPTYTTGMFAPQKITPSVQNMIAVKTGQAAQVGATGLNNLYGFLNAGGNALAAAPSSFVEIEQRGFQNMYNLGYNAVVGAQKWYDNTQLSVSNYLKTSTGYSDEKLVGYTQLGAKTTSIMMGVYPAYNAFYNLMPKLEQAVELYAPVATEFKPVYQVPQKFLEGNVKGAYEKPLDTAVLFAASFALPGAGKLVSKIGEASPGIKALQTGKYSRYVFGEIEGFKGIPESERVVNIPAGNIPILGKIPALRLMLGEPIAGVIESPMAQRFVSGSGQYINIPIASAEAYIAGAWGRSALERITGTEVTKSRTTTTTLPTGEIQTNTETWTELQSPFSGRAIFFGLPIQGPGQKPIDWTFPEATKMAGTAGEIYSTEVLPAMGGLIAGQIVTEKAIDWYRTRGDIKLSVRPSNEVAAYTTDAAMNYYKMDLARLERGIVETAPRSSGVGAIGSPVNAPFKLPKISTDTSLSFKNLLGGAGEYIEYKVALFRIGSQKRTAYAELSKMEEGEVAIKLPGLQRMGKTPEGEAAAEMGFYSAYFPSSAKAERFIQDITTVLNYESKRKGAGTSAQWGELWKAIEVSRSLNVKPVESFPVTLRRAGFFSEGQRAEYMADLLAGTKEHPTTVFGGALQSYYGLKYQKPIADLDLLSERPGAIGKRAVQEFDNELFSYAQLYHRFKWEGLEREEMIEADTLYLMPKDIQDLNTESKLTKVAEVFPPSALRSPRKMEYGLRPPPTHEVEPGLEVISYGEQVSNVLFRTMIPAVNEKGLIQFTTKPKNIKANVDAYALLLDLEARSGEKFPALKTEYLNRIEQTRSVSSTYVDKRIADYGLPMPKKNKQGTYEFNMGFDPRKWFSRTKEEKVEWKGIGYEGPGYPTNPLATRNEGRDLVYSFEQGTLFPAPTKLSGTKPGQSSVIEYVPEHAYLPHEPATNKYMWTVWEEDIGPVGTVFPLQRGQHELPAMFGAPVLEGHFAHVGVSGENWKLFGFGFPKISEPSAIRTQVTGFRPVPRAVRGNYGLMERYLANEWPSGEVALPMRKEEYEGVLPQYTKEGRTNLRVTARDYYVTIGHRRVPIIEASVDVPTPWSELKGVQRPEPIKFIGNPNTAGLTTEQVLAGASAQDRRAMQAMFNVGQEIEGMRTGGVYAIDLNLVETLPRGSGEAVGNILAKYDATVAGSGARLGQMSVDRYLSVYGKYPKDLDLRVSNYRGAAYDLSQTLGARQVEKSRNIQIESRQGGTLIDVNPYNRVQSNPFGWEPPKGIQTSEGYYIETMDTQVQRYVYNAYNIILGRKDVMRGEFTGRWSRQAKDTERLFSDVSVLLEDNPKAANREAIAREMRIIREHPEVGRTLGNKKFRYGSGKDEFFSGYDVPGELYNFGYEQSLINPTVIGFGVGVIPKQGKVYNTTTTTKAPSAYADVGGDVYYSAARNEPTYLGGSSVLSKNNISYINETSSGNNVYGGTSKKGESYKGSVYGGSTVYTPTGYTRYIGGRSYGGVSNVYNGIVSKDIGYYKGRSYGGISSIYGGSVNRGYNSYKQTGYYTPQYYVGQLYGGISSIYGGSVSKDVGYYGSSSYGGGSGIYGGSISQDVEYSKGRSYSGSGYSSQYGRRSYGSGYGIYGGSVSRSSGYSKSGYSGGVSYGGGYYGGGYYSGGVTPGGSITRTGKTTGSTNNKFNITAKTWGSVSRMPFTIKTPPLIPTAPILEVDRKVKRRRRRGVLVSQWLIKNPVPRISTVYGPYKWRYNVDTPAFGRKFSGSKVIVQSFPGDTTWLKKRGI